MRLKIYAVIIILLITALLPVSCDNTAGNYKTAAAIRLRDALKRREAKNA